MKKCIVFLAISICGVSAFSQVNIQPYGSFVRNLNPDFRGNSFGGGFRLEMGTGVESKISYYVGLSYAAPIVTKQEVQANAYSNMTEPSYVPVTATYKLPIYRIDGGLRYYFVGANDKYDGFNFYGNFGAEICYVPNKPEYSAYDKELYTLGWSADSDVNEDGSEKFALNFMIAAGLGVEKNIGPGNIFLHTALGFPAFAKGDDGSDLAAFAPIPVNFSLGYKIPFGGK